MFEHGAFNNFNFKVAVGYLQIKMLARCQLQSLQSFTQYVI